MLLNEGYAVLFPDSFSAARSPLEICTLKSR